MNRWYERLDGARRCWSSARRMASLLSAVVASAVFTACPGGDPTKPGCGNTVVDSLIGESCDDGNIVAGDGCSDSCQVEVGYSCETDGQPCFSTCGDGIIAGDEECDEGPWDPETGDFCSWDCELPGVCGNGIVEWNELCDRGAGNEWGGLCEPNCRGLFTD